MVIDDFFFPQTHKNVRIKLYGLLPNTLFHLTTADLIWCIIWHKFKNTILYIKSEYPDLAHKFLPVLKSYFFFSIT